MVKKILNFFIMGLCVFGMTGCSASDHTGASSAQDSLPESGGEQTVLCSIRITADDAVFDGVLYDNPTARGFAEILPLTAGLWDAAPGFATAFDLSAANSNEVTKNEGMAEGGEAVYTADTKVWDVINDPAFEDYGRLIFPADRSISDNLTLGDVGNILTWYSYVDPDRTVEIVNYLKEHAVSEEQIFYDIYTEEEKAADPAKEDTGLFFFRGTPGEKFAIINAGGGFVYVAAMHDSFPHALELSKKGYNAFALIYRPGAQTACEDLARAIAYIHEHAEELEVDVSDYSLWGGSAGARMAAWLGSYGTEAFGETDYPKPGAVIMQYTGLSEVTGAEPPTYACVGTSDGIAYYGTMEERIRRIRAQETSAEIEVFDGLPHGFGLGEGTVAEGWLDNAVQFWEKNMEK